MISDIGGYCRLFEGYEAEGMFNGLWTLFVSGDVPFEKIEDVIKNRSVIRPYNQLYFGADRLSPINWTTVIQCMAKPLLLTVEVGYDKIPLNIKTAHNVYVVFKINRLEEKQISDMMSDFESMKQRVQIKFDSRFGSYLVPLKYVTFNSYIMLKDDTELWRQDEAPLKR